MDDSANFDNPPGGSRGGSGGGLSEWTKDNFGGGHKTSAKALTTNPSSEPTLADYRGVPVPPGAEASMGLAPVQQRTSENRTVTPPAAKPPIFGPEYAKTVPGQVIAFGKGEDPAGGQQLREWGVLPENALEKKAFLKGVDVPTAERTLSELGRGIFNNQVPENWQSLFQPKDIYFNIDLGGVLLKGNPKDAAVWNKYQADIAELIDTYVLDEKTIPADRVSRVKILGAVRPYLNVLLGEKNSVLDQVQWPKAAVPGEVSR